MKLRMKTLTRAILATSLVAGLGFSQTALAESANGTIEITAGLSEALTVSCTGLDFGTVRVPIDGGAGTVEITSAVNSTAAATGTGFSAGGGSSSTCTISGSTATEGDLSVTFSDVVSGVVVEDSTFSLADSSNTNALTNLDVTLSASTLDFAANPTPTQFFIGGSLSIPGNLSADNLGDYSLTAQVNIDDSV